MRILILLLVAMLGLPATGRAAVTLIQSGCAGPSDLFNSTAEYIYTYPGALTSGSLAVIIIKTGGRNHTAVSGTGASYTINGAQTSWGGGNISQWKAVTTDAGTTATITLSGTQSDASDMVCFLEFAGIDSDQSGSTANGANIDPAATDHASGSVTPPTANNVVVGSQTRPSATWTDDVGFTEVNTGSDNLYVGYILQTAATAQELNNTSDTTKNSGMRIGAFAGTADGGGGGSGPPLGSHSLLGVGR